MESIEPAPTYELSAERFLETNMTEFYDWPVHMAEKNWIDIEAFIEAFAKALKGIAFGFNFFYIDDHGTIGYWHVGKLPIRPANADPVATHLRVEPVVRFGRTCVLRRLTI